MTDNDLQGSVARFGEAWAQGDLATLESLLSKTYTHTDVFGMFHDRAAWLRYVGGRTGRATQIGFRDVETRVLGDVAVVTGVNDVTGPGARSAGDHRSTVAAFHAGLDTSGRQVAARGLSGDTDRRFEPCHMRIDCAYRSRGIAIAFDSGRPA